MKVGILTNSYPPNLNGVSRSVINLEKSLKKLGVEVFIITPKVPGVVYETNVLALPSYSAPQKVSSDLQVPYNYVQKCVQFIKKHNIDILHSQDTLIGGVEAVIIAMKCQIPCTHTYHTMVEDYDYFRFPGYQKFIRTYSQTVCDGYDAVVAVSPKTYNYLQQIGVQTPIYQIPNVLLLPELTKKSPPNKLQTEEKSHNLLETNFESEKKMQKVENKKINPYLKGKFPNLPTQAKNSFNFVTFGRIAKEKSLELGIKILKPLLQKYPINYIIAGIGPEMESLQNFIISQKLENKVFLIGKYDNESLVDLCSFCDVFVNTSTSENLPTTDFEALSLGLPVVAIADLAHQFFVENDNLDFLEENLAENKLTEIENNLQKLPNYQNDKNQTDKNNSNLQIQKAPFAKFLKYIQKAQNKIENQNQKNFQNWFQNWQKIIENHQNNTKNPKIEIKSQTTNSKISSGIGSKFRSNIDQELQIFQKETSVNISWTSRNEMISKNFLKLSNLIQRFQENENWQIGEFNPNQWEKRIKQTSSNKNISNLKKDLKQKIEKITKDSSQDSDQKVKLPNGFCVEIDKMALCCEKLYLDKELRHRLSQNAIKTAQNLVKRQVELEYLDLYKKLIEEKQIEKVKNKNRFRPIFENFEELTEKLQVSWQNWLTK